MFSASDLRNLRQPYVRVSCEWAIRQNGYGSAD